MKFTPIKFPYSASNCWVSGIYKVSSFRPGEYQAYYIRDGQKNWGDRVATPPDISQHGNRCWKTPEAAQKACEAHARTHTPKPATVRRAREIVEAHREKR